MHPAYSVIFFTTASGAGYGLLFWLSLADLFGAMPFGRWGAVFSLAIALALITGGLLASTFHLGHPERAIGAFSQWRTSWLSREGVAAVATYVPAGLKGLLWLFGVDTGLSAFLALLSAVGAVVTVYCTGMIYASLRTIRQWNRTDVPWIYLALAAATGGLLFALLSVGSGTTACAVVVLLALIAAGVLKFRYWKSIDADPGAYTAEMALGLNDLGTVRPLDPPHTMPNFVMREMGFSVARNHAQKLRRIVMLLLFLVPIVLTLLALAVGASTLLLLLAVVSAGIGVVTERWLFFAEAEHVSQLFYGRARA